MKLIQHGAPGVSLADHFTAMRDSPTLARPHNPSEAVAERELRELMPPSKAHLKRLKRHAAEIPFYEVPRAYPAPSPAVMRARAQLDQHKRDIAALGGSPVIVGEHEPHRAPVMGETTLQRWRREQNERQLQADNAVAAKHERANNAWRAAATGQGELFA